MKVTVFVNEIFKSVDQCQQESAKPKLGVSNYSFNRFLNPGAIQVQMPSPSFSYGAFEHVPAGQTKLGVFRA